MWSIGCNSDAFVLSSRLCFEGRCLLFVMLVLSDPLAFAAGALKHGCAGPINLAYIECALQF